MSFLNDIKKLFSGKQSWLFLAVIIVLALGLAHYSSNKGLLGENMTGQRLMSQNDPSVTGEKLAAQQAGNVQPSAPLGGNGGFTIYKEGAFKTFNAKDGIPFGYVNTMMVEGTNIWLGTLDGLVLYNGKKFRVYTEDDGRGFGGSCSTKF